MMFGLCAAQGHSQLSGTASLKEAKGEPALGGGAPTTGTGVGGSSFLLQVSMIVTPDKTFLFVIAKSCSLLHSWLRR